MLRHRFSNHHASIILTLAIVAATATYWLGLSGPFMLDDGWNLSPLTQWMKGGASWQETLLPQVSWLASRPVAMASFMLSIWIGGPDSFSFKLGNLIVHIACGLIGYRVIRCALREDPCLAKHSDLIAALIATIWLLHPLQVSTVLYAVQRMAQLSTLFSLLAVGAYFAGRHQLLEGRRRAASLNLFLLFPLSVLLGVLSKQNAAAVPAICLAFEFAYFYKKHPASNTIRLFFVLFLALPVAAVAAILLLSPEKILAGYGIWDFSLGERLLTQPRVLVDYLAMLIIPRGPAMGLYTDDYIVSTGLLSPATTILAILFLAIVTIAAVATRKRAPSVTAGWLCFLAAHAVESTFLPLEMYYEHRNYLPSFWLWLALAGLCALVPANVRTNFFTLRQLALISVFGFVTVLCTATFGRVLVWQDMETILRLALQQHPESLRANFDLAVIAAQRGDRETGLKLMVGLSQSENPRYRLLGHLGAAAEKCATRQPGGSTHLKLAATERVTRISNNEAQVIVKLSQLSKSGSCGDVPGQLIADSIRQIIERTDGQAESVAPKAVARYAIAQIYANSNAWQNAEDQAAIAWKATHDSRVGAFLTRIYLHNGRVNEAAATLAMVEKGIRDSELDGQREIAALRRMVRDKKGAADNSRRAEQ